MKKYDVLSLGEILIDFTPVNKTSGMSFDANPGGAPANACCACAKLGANSAFIGKAGTDAFGDECKKALESCSCSTEYLFRDPDHHTTFAFVTLSENGERSFTFCRNDGADIFLSEKEIPYDAIRQSVFLHTGALSLVSEPASSATISALEFAKKNNVLVSYDPNWRGALWKNKDEGIEKSMSLFKYADFIKISDEELGIFFDCKKEEAAKKLLDMGAKLVCITLGKDGVYYAMKNMSGCVKIPSGNFPVVDTTGAGDSFTGALLFRLTRRSDVFGTTKEQLEKDLMFANSAASICITRRGAIPALASLDEVNEVLSRQ